ncbi:hypothetical protein EMCRGX_G025967 [Ephydatia muelleri]
MASQVLTRLADTSPDKIFSMPTKGTVTEARKHLANDPKCSELSWVCVPMVAESYGWSLASAIISSIASRLTISTGKPKSVVLSDIYGQLNVHLVRANARAILSRIAPPA